MMAEHTVEWCESCSRLVAKEAVDIDRHGTHRCPLCRSELRRASPEQEAQTQETDSRARAPWHFKLLVVATVVYLIYRTIWIIQRATHHG